MQIEEVRTPESGADRPFQVEVGYSPKTGGNVSRPKGLRNGPGCLAHAECFDWHAVVLDGRDGGLAYPLLGFVQRRANAHEHVRAQPGQKKAPFSCEAEPLLIRLSLRPSMTNAWTIS
jgi:hypothetical protein